MTFRVLQWSLWLIGLGLQYLVVSALLQGPWRQFRTVLTYVVVLGITTLADIAAFHTIRKDLDLYRTYYYTAELSRQTCLFAIITSLIVSRLEQARSRRATIRAAVAFAIVFWASSLGLHWHLDVNTWMTKVVRNLSFASAIGNLALWFSLISAEPRDVRRLMIAGGLGMQMTGEAMGQSIRHLWPGSEMYFAGSLLVVFAHFLCLLIWWQAFSRQEDVHVHAR